MCVIQTKSVIHRLRNKCGMKPVFFFFFLNFLFNVFYLFFCFAILPYAFSFCSLGGFAVRTTGIVPTYRTLRRICLVELLPSSLCAGSFNGAQSCVATHPQTNLIDAVILVADAARRIREACKKLLSPPDLAPHRSPFNEKYLKSASRAMLFSLAIVQPIDQIQNTQTNASLSDR